MISWLKSLFQGRTFGAGRSPKWREIRKRYLKNHPDCEVCDRGPKILKPIEVHHLVPVHIDKSKELDSNNLISVCREHHFWFCHLGSWKSYNKTAKEDCQVWADKIKYR